MKKYLLLLLSFVLFLSIGCKKDENAAKQADSISQTKKCAKYSIGVFKDKELTTWMSNLSKAEPVDLISTEIVSDGKGKTVEVAYIKLSDDSKGYIKTQNLADRPIVFITNAKTYERNNEGSRIKSTIPAGKMGFVIDEKADWLQIYVGEIDGKWVTQDWVNDGFSSDASLLTDAKLYEEAITVLFPAAGAKQPTETQKSEAVKKLEDIYSSSSSSLFRDLASQRLEAYYSVPQETDESDNDNK